jgi:4-amino-4-deoxy-L-arabinose transferase-like glycosyltransferase
MVYRYGQIPIAPVIGDEVIINEPAVALSRGQGLISPGFRDSAFGLDKLYAHFPPVYIFAEALAFRAFGVSVYSLRLVTTVMGVASAGLFLLLLWCICRWNLADWGTASVAACLYTLTATMLVLHRLARMESMVEYLTLGSLLCVLTGIYSKPETPRPMASPNPRRTETTVDVSYFCWLRR